MDNILNEEIESMINSEICKIENDERNESNLAKLTYLQVVSNGIINLIPKIGNSNDKEGELLRWRYAQNECRWLEALLLQGKTIAVQNRIGEIEILENSNSAKKSEHSEELEMLKFYKDMVKLNYYQSISNYEEIMKERRYIESTDINLDDLQISSRQIIENVKKLDKEASMIFWEKYFKLAADHIYSLENTKDILEKMMGE